MKGGLDNYLQYCTVFNSLCLTWNGLLKSLPFVDLEPDREKLTWSSPTCRLRPHSTTHFSLVATKIAQYSADCFPEAATYLDRLIRFIHGALLFARNSSHP